MTPSRRKTEINWPERPGQMAKFSGIVERRLLTVTEKENELTLVFEDNRFLFVSLKDGKLHSESVPE